MKIVKIDYPFTIIVENKVSKAGNKYLSIGLGITEKNPNATCDEEKYNTKWFNFIDERDLLKLQAVANGAYLTLKEEQENEKKAQKMTVGMVKPDLPKTGPNTPFIDDSVPF